MRTYTKKYTEMALLPLVVGCGLLPPSSLMMSGRAWTITLINVHVFLLNLMILNKG